MIPKEEADIIVDDGADKASDYGATTKFSFTRFSSKKFIIYCFSDRNLSRNRSESQIQVIQDETDDKPTAEPSLVLFFQVSSKRSHKLVRFCFPSWSPGLVWFWPESF